MVNESSNPSKNIPKIAEKVTKNDSDIEIIDDLNIKVDKEAQKKDIFICNCKKEDQHRNRHLRYDSITQKPPALSDSRCHMQQSLL